MKRQSCHASPAPRQFNGKLAFHSPGLDGLTKAIDECIARGTNCIAFKWIPASIETTSLGTGFNPRALPQASPAIPTTAFKVYSNYVALPLSEAFRIEYWKLEEAKLRGQNSEKELEPATRQTVASTTSESGRAGFGNSVVLIARTPAHADGAHNFAATL